MKSYHSRSRKRLRSGASQGPHHKISLTFSDGTRKNFSVASHIRRCICAVLSEEGVSVPCEIDVLLTTDRGIRRLNQAQRGIDRPTDVLSFPAFTLIPEHLPQNWTTFQDPDSGLVPLGDMAISLERAAEQAKQFGHSVSREVGYLTIHSVLHLLGYDHMDEGPMKKQMRAHEEAVLTAIGLTR